MSKETKECVPFGQDASAMRSVDFSKSYAMRAAAAREHPRLRITRTSSRVCQNHLLSKWHTQRRDLRYTPVQSG